MCKRAPQLQPDVNIPRDVSSTTLRSDDDHLFGKSMSAAFFNESPLCLVNKAVSGDTLICSVSTLLVHKVAMNLHDSTIYCYGAARSHFSICRQKLRYISVGAMENAHFSYLTNDQSW